MSVLQRLCRHGAVVDALRLAGEAACWGRARPWSLQGTASATSGSSTLSQQRLISSGVAARAPEVDAETDVEKKIAAKLAAALKGAVKVAVRDTSGGCGAMYAIEVVADDFKGLSIVKQHQAVHRALAEDIKQWHGLNLTTKAP